MFNIKKYIVTQTKLNEIDKKFNILKKIESKLYDKKFSINCSCEHDLILVYDIHYKNDSDQEDYRAATCLICNKHLKVKYSFLINKKSVFSIYKLYASDDTINPDYIIDVTSYIPEEYRNYWCKDRNELVSVAQDILNKVEYDSEISLDEIKLKIKDGLIKHYKNRDVELKKVYKRDDKHE